MENDARRLSRLIMSDMKLYNEQAVKEGCEQRDLYSRLREDIDRARAIYDKRIDRWLVNRDYFHEEMVAVLCGGNEKALGAEYPGPPPRPFTN